MIPVPRLVKQFQVSDRVNESADTYLDYRDNWAVNGAAVNSTPTGEMETVSGETRNWRSVLLWTISTARSFCNACVSSGKKGEWRKLQRLERKQD